MIQTARLDLLPSTLALVTADLHRRDELTALIGATIGEGWPPPLLTVAAMQRLKESLNNEPHHQGWTTYYVVERAKRVLIGICGFKSKPKNKSAEMGYTLLPQFQNKGFGTEVVGALSAWALGHDEVLRVYAETLPELIPSQRVLEKNGFIRSGTASEPGVLRYEQSRSNARTADWKASSSR